MEQFYWYWLSKLEEVGPAGRKRLLKEFGSPEKVYSANPVRIEKIAELRPKQKQVLVDSKIKKQAEEEFHKLHAKGIHFITKGERDFPESLREIPQAPDFLFYRGRLPEEKKLSVAMIGARECSARGRKLAEEFAGELAAAGVQIISGMARGIDGYSQRAALEYGSSFGVLGCGVDFCYPPENYALYEALLERGGILSEYPPGSKPVAYHFPMRNRLIAGLSDGLVVIEARKKSGTLITVEFALEQSKMVFAVPGQTGSALGEGCDELLADGACAVNSARDIVEELAGQYFAVKEIKKNNFLLEEAEKIVYANVSLEPKHLEELLKITGWEPAKLMQTLFSLEMRGVIYSPAGNYYMAK